MTDAIVIVVLVIMIGSAIAYMIKAKKSGVKCIGCPAGGSCSSGKIKRKKLDGPIIGRKTMKISGMHCEHCAMNVTKALNQIDGVLAEVSASKGSAMVVYDREIAEEVLKGAVEKSGYKVVEIS